MMAATGLSRNDFSLSKQTNFINSQCDTGCETKTTTTTTNKQTIFSMSSWSQPSMRPERKKLGLQGSKRRKRENSNQAESFQNQQTEASLLNNKKIPFSCSQIFV